LIGYYEQHTRFYWTAIVHGECSQAKANRQTRQPAKKSTKWTKKFTCFYTDFLSQNSASYDRTIWVVLQWCSMKLMSEMHSQTTDLNVTSMSANICQSTATYLYFDSRRTGNCWGSGDGPSNASKFEKFGGFYKHRQNKIQIIQVSLIACDRINQKLHQLINNSLRSLPVSTFTMPQN